MRQKARANFLKNATKQMSQGSLGFREAIEEAQELLAFVPDDRAPHGFVMTCKRKYMVRMVQHLAQAE